MVALSNVYTSLREDPARVLPKDYRLMFRVSWSSSSDVVITRELAWNPRWW